MTAWHPDPALARLDDVARRWIAASVGRRAKVVHVRRLISGGWSSLHAVTVEKASGTRLHLVVKRLYRPMFGDYSERAVRWERRSLQAAEHVDVATPHLVAVDPEGNAAGAPAVLMTKVPGRVEMHVTPGVVDGLADALRRVHAVSGETVELRPWAPWRIRSDLEVPRWVKDASVWTELRDLIASGRTPAHANGVLLHGDYHPGNVLWRRGRVTGVIDWQVSNTGDPELDLAHCRSNLAFLEGVDAADLLLRSYRGDDEHTDAQRWYDAVDAATFLPDPVDAWDWSGMGRPDLSRAVLRRRLERWVRRILR